MIRGYPSPRRNIPRRPARPLPGYTPVPANDNVPGGPRYRLPPTPRPANDNFEREAQRAFGRSIGRRLFQMARPGFTDLAQMALSRPSAAGGPQVNAEGYTLQVDCGRTPNCRANGTFPDCTGTFVISNVQTFPLNFTNRPTSFTLYESYGWAGPPYQQTQHLASGAQRWVRTVTAGALPSITVGADIPPVIVPAVRPGVTPAGVPMIAPAGVPFTVPFWAIPHRRVDDTPQGHDHGYIYRPDPRVEPWVRPDAPPRPRPDVWPQPPGPKVKEHKALWRTANAAVTKYLGWSTELLDHLDAVWNATPYRARSRWRYEFWQHNGRAPRPDERARWLYRNSHLIDWQKVLVNLGRNELTDRFIGGLSQRANQRQEGRWGPGWSVGPAL